MVILTEKIIFRICPICLHNLGEVLHTQHFIIPIDYKLNESYDLVCCKNCGFCYADVKASQNDYDVFYTECSKYIDKKVSSGVNFTAWDKERFKEVARNISGVLVKRKAKILDIGCANGGLLAALKEAGYENLVGIDPAHECVSNVKKQGFEAYIGGIFSEFFLALSEKEKFDCIILSHVLEHVYDIRIAVKNILTKLKMGGVLYIEVPDASRYKDFYKVPYYYFDYEHINHFDEHALENLLSQFSFKYLISSKKEISASSTDSYPAVYVVYKKVSSQDYQRRIMFSPAVRDNIIKYIQLSRDDPVLNQLEKLVDSQETIVVWGAGSYTTRLLSDTLLGKCNIAFLVDNDPNKQSLMLNKLEVCSPERLKAHRGPIVISSALFSNEILQDIKKMGLGNKVFVLRQLNS